MKIEKKQFYNQKRQTKVKPKRYTESKLYYKEILIILYKNK